MNIAPLLIAGAAGLAAYAILGKKDDEKKGETPVQVSGGSSSTSYAPTDASVKYETDNRVDNRVMDTGSGPTVSGTNAFANTQPTLPSPTQPYAPAPTPAPSQQTVVDSDGDGVPDAEDAFPMDKTRWMASQGPAAPATQSSDPFAQNYMGPQTEAESQASMGGRSPQQQRVWEAEQRYGEGSPQAQAAYQESYGPGSQQQARPAPAPRQESTQTQQGATTYNENGAYGASFFEHTKYGGKGVALRPGRYDVADLARLGIPNDWVSSFKVASGYRVLAYEDSGFRGSQIGGTADIDNLVPSGWNDRISSIVITKV